MSHLAVHPPDQCSGEYCCIHNPSPHHMRDWPMNWRSDKGIMERICPHGVGHPDPDGAAHEERMGRGYLNVHGCDGCCAPPSKGIGGHQSAKMGKDEWLTPPEILKALGAFDLDPCSPINRPWPTATTHYTIIDNGLLLPWDGRAFCNPPYGRETGKWLARCAEHGNAIALIFARTETADWVEHVWKKAHSILFLWGRLYFHHVDGRRASANSGAPSALISYNPSNTESLSQSGLAGQLVRL